MKTYQMVDPEAGLKHTFQTTCDDETDNGCVVRGVAAQQLCEKPEGEGWSIDLHYHNDTAGTTQFLAWVRQVPNSSG